ncbi:antigen 5 like allergen Cul n 1 [Drosophila busckii]|uniref:antigen 5 like allergen Cul n 1 n=1 Tax=Drosophila busckii TaxID=30019 RepID=UPI00083F4181|nr:antigen 5 like allergen Cul n 1 [Drosophila busckii]
MNIWLLVSMLLCVSQQLLAAKVPDPVAVGALPTGRNNSYCEPQLCARGKQHVACDKSLNEAQRTCSVEQAQLLNLTNYADVIVKTHNELRQRLASGKNMTLPRAARMVAMQWSEELATLASYNSRMCQAKHDACRNTANFKRSGQNIIVFNLTRLVENELMDKLYPELLQLGVRSWWAEHSNGSNIMNEADVEHYSCTYKRPQHLFRHFAVMAVENNTHVGCAGVRYLTKQLTHFKLTCNYAEDFVCGKQIYHTRSSACQTGPNPHHKALCSKKETFA